LKSSIFQLKAAKKDTSGIHTQGVTSRNQKKSPERERSRILTAANETLNAEVFPK